LAKWGDRKNAIWVWESVVVSRPYVTAIMGNIAKGYAQIGNFDKAFEYLARCEKLQPNTPAVRSLKVVLMSRNGKLAQAAVLAQAYMNDGIYDYDLVNVAFVLGMRTGDFDMAIQALTIRSKEWPATQRDAQLKLAGIYVNNKKDAAKALAAFKAALELTPDEYRDNLRKQIPPQFQAQL
jgi:tetratricopeptide (TPR) repeat protein